MTSGFPHATMTLACASAVCLSLAGCGGGGDVSSGAGLQVQAAQDSERQQALAVGNPPAVGAIALASSNAAGVARGGFSLCAISADGSIVAFTSSSSGLVAGDTNGTTDIFVKNLRSGAIVRANTTSAGAQMISTPLCNAMTADGRSIVFNVDSEVFVKNLATGALTKASPTIASVQANAGFTGGAISDDGAKVIFTTVPTQSYVGQYTYVNDVPARVMLRDLTTGALTTLATDDGNSAHGEVIFGGLSISPDGKKVLFVSTASTLVPGDTNLQPDVFVRDLASGATTLVSSTSDGVPAIATFCCNSSYYNGRFVSNNVVQFLPAQPSSLGPRGNYLKNLSSGALMLAISTPNGGSASISGDGNFAAFENFYNGYSTRSFVRDLRTGQDRLVSTSAANMASNGSTTASLISRDGTSVALQSTATNLVTPAPPANVFQVYVKTIAAAVAGAL